MVTTSAVIDKSYLKVSGSWTTPAQIERSSQLRAAAIVTKSWRGGANLASGGDALIVAALAADDPLAFGERHEALWPNADERPIGKRLMRTPDVIEGEEFADKMIEVLLTKDDEVVEALDLDRPDPPFDEGVLVRRSRSRRLDADVSLLKDGVEIADVHAVPIADEMLHRQSSVPSLFEDRFSLTNHPRRIRLEAARRAEQ